MKITTRRGAVAFFIALGAVLVAIAIALNVTWIIHWRDFVPAAIGIVLFALIIAGLVVNTIFVVREIRRNEQYDSFLNAVTHELRTPVASIRLYLETLQSREVTDTQRREFYQYMLSDTNRLIRTVDQLLRAAETTQTQGERNWTTVDMLRLLGECTELARVRHQLPEGALTEEYHGCASAAPTALGDPDELRIAVGNVLDNAVKYSRGNVHIRLIQCAGARARTPKTATVSKVLVSGPLPDSSHTPADRKLRRSRGRLCALANVARDRRAPVSATITREKISR